MMNWLEITQTIVATTVSAYWACVIAMVGRSWIRFRVSSGSLPKDRLEKRMWAIWVPTIVAWIALAWNSENVIANVAGSELSSSPWLIWQAFVWLASGACVAAFLLTVRCWMSMGSDWSMAVTPDKETRLITDGPFSRVRHPIYSLSLMLMISSLIVITNFWMLLIATIHCSMLVVKAWNEERYLTKLHGQQYRNYLRSTNRFVPSLASGRSASA